MKLLAINGSYRGRNGFSYKCINKIFDGAKKAGASCEIVNLSEKKIIECCVCNTCQKQGDHYLKCINHDKDDVFEIFEKMRSADMIIFSTPLYIWTISGLLKKFLDRYYSAGDSKILRVTESGNIFHHTIREIFVKPFVALTCGNNFEIDAYDNVVDYFRKYSTFIEAKQVAMFVRRSSIIFDDPHDDRIKSRIKDVYQAFFDAGYELAVSGKIKSATVKRVNQNILPIPPILDVLKKNKFMKKIINQKMLQTINENEKEFSEISQ